MTRNSDTGSRKGEDLVKKRLYRSRTERVLGGVAGGLAAYLDVDVVLVRIIWVLLALMGGPGILGYIICWLVIPEEPEGEPGKAKKPEPEPGDAPAGEGEEKEEGEEEEGERKEPEEAAPDGGRRVIGLFLVVLGIFFPLQRLGGVCLNVLHRLFPGFYWHQFWQLARSLFWPALLVVVGLILVAGGLRGRKR